MVGETQCRCSYQLIVKIFGFHPWLSVKKNLIYLASVGDYICNF